MKAIYFIIILGIVGMTGCTTSSQMQEMIDASHQDYQSISAAHETSINSLKESSMDRQEKNKENAKMLAEVQTTLAEVMVQLETIKGYAEASKVLSAANTVKVADLDAAGKVNQESVNETIRQLSEIDKLYETVMIQHYQTIADNAHESIKALKADGVTATTNAPVKLDEPIEIIAPDTWAMISADPGTTE